MRLSIAANNSNQNDTKEFGEWLLKFGDGESEIELPANIVIPNSKEAFDKLINFVYPNSEHVI